VADLFSSLTAATRALEAQRFALDVTGQNIANVNTPGYSRRVVDFQAVPPDTLHEAGRGVRVEGVRAQRDRLIERRLEQETGGAERETAIATLLAVAERAIGGIGEGVDAQLTEFFDSFARLADAPTSAVARQQVVLQGTALARAFGEAASEFASVQRDADRRISETVDEINEIASRLAMLNDSISGNYGSTAALHFADEQAALVKRLSGLADINVIERSDGGIDVDLAGRTLVVANSAYSVTAIPVGPQGQLAVTIGGADVTSQLTGGTLGGALAVRDVHIPAYQHALDEQAFALADAVNALHAAGYDLSGNTGQDFFTFSVAPVGVTGAASALIVDPTVAADASRVAAAEAPLAGDNRVARQLADVRDALLLDGGTASLGDAWGQLVFSVGRDLQHATQESSLRQQILLQLQSLRDQVSGVSLDEEAMQLMKFQRAYEANARFFAVVDETLETLLTTFGR
jgi:flagellar hook-associated protein 1 FlgK